MLAELRTRSQITLPKDIVTALDLSEGDRLEIYEKDGMICVVPVAVYPKRTLEDLHSEIETLKEKIKSGEQPVFDSIDALMNDPEKD